MCRWMAWFGQSVLIEDVLFKAPQLRRLERRELVGGALCDQRRLVHRRAGARELEGARIKVALAGHSSGR